MRVTSGSMAVNLGKNLRDIQKRYNLLQNQLSLGKRFINPSEDPNANASAMRLRGGYAASEQYAKNIADGKSWLDAADAALDHLGQVLIRVQELAVKGGDGTNPAEARMAIANEVSQMAQQAAQIANSTHGAKHIFAGFKYDAAPFAINTATLVVTRNNPADGSQKIQREIGKGVRMDVNVTGDALLAGGDFFAVIKSLHDDLVAGNITSISTTRMTEIQNATNSLMAIRSDVGARINRLETGAAQVMSSQVNVAGLLSQIEDADMAKLMLDLKQAESAQQMALAVGARIIPPTLVDFLR